jgi:hypothetical protein
MREGSSVWERGVSGRRKVIRRELPSGVREVMVAVVSTWPYVGD